MKFAKYALATSLVATTVVGSALVFNTEAAIKVWSNIEALKSKIVAFASNDSKLVEKYNSLKSDAEEKINKLEIELKEKTSASEEEKKKLKDEINRLEGEVNKANLAIVALQAQSDLAVNELSEYNPTDASTLPGLDGSVEEEESPVNAYFYHDNVHITINLEKEIKLVPYSTKGNVLIEYYKGDGTLLQRKDNSWCGYLNGEVNGEEQKYGRGVLHDKKNGEATCSNKEGKTCSSILKPGTYSSVLNHTDDTKISKVVVKVTDNEGKLVIDETIPNTK